MKVTATCHDCKEVFRKEEMIQYASPTGKTLYWYCHNCYEERMARERFSRKVCEIFQLKSPGPRIWTERKRLRNNYGYTDDTIVDCLEYIYEVEKKDKLAESLALVTPRYVAAMKTWKAQQKALGGRLIAASQTTTVEKRIVNIPEPKSVKKEINLDDGLYDD